MYECEPVNFFGQVTKMSVFHKYFIYKLLNFIKVSRKALPTGILACGIQEGHGAMVPTSNRSEMNVAYMVQCRREMKKRRGNVGFNSADDAYLPKQSQCKLS